MRTVSFSNPRVKKLLSDSFYCTLTNIEGDASAGVSLRHAPHDRPGTNARGIGRQNVQTLFTTADGRIFHVASGFLSPQDLLKEASFALQLHKRLREHPDKAIRLVQTAQQKRLKRVPRRGGLLSFTGSTPVQDSQFLVRHPLLSREELQKNPRLLVGNAQTAYGSGFASGSPGVRGFRASSSETTSERKTRRVVIQRK